MEELSNPLLLEGLAIVDAVTAKWAKTVVPLYMRDLDSKHKVQGIGSGFICSTAGSHYLVTALHVLRQHVAGEALAGIFNGEAAALNDLPFLAIESEDLAIAELTSNWAKRQEIISKGTLPSIPLDARSHKVEPLEIFILMGFPGAKNRLNSRVGELNRYLVGYSVFKKLGLPTATTHVNSAIAFHFDKKAAIDSNGNKVNVGLFNGNSGGPVIELSWDTRGFGTLVVDLAGVFVGWNKISKELICIKPEALRNAIQEYRDSTLL